MAEVTGPDGVGRVTAPQQYANGNLALLHDALTVLLTVRRISATPNGHMNVVEVKINTSLVQIVDARVADGRQNAAQVGITGIKSGLALTLDKNLPIAAGIGGGSADAAAALRLAAKIWQLGPDTIGPEAIAPAIGADVPACLHAQSCYGSGVGDALTNAPDLGLKGQPILLVNPNVACPTGPVFAAWDGVDRGPLSLKDWQLGRNDLEQPAIGLVPVITDVLALLAKQPGVDLVRMSGSGATCFALFSDAQKRDAAAKAIAAARPSWWTLATRLR